MNTPLSGIKPIRLLRVVLLGITTLTVLLLSSARSFVENAVVPIGPFGPACGTATIDGVVNEDEWSGASTQTFQMYRPSGGVPFTVTLRVMNDGQYLYMGLTVDDDEFSSYAQYLPQGDAFRIDFDNDHGGVLFAVGDDVLSVTAGTPQFQDNYLTGGTSASADALHGGTTDGTGAASRVGDLNHFEIRHPLCSGDSLDFCLHPGDLVGFRLEYLDAESNGTLGSTQVFPGQNSEADIVISGCATPARAIYLPRVEE